jgi:hypothetical protein
MIPWIDLLWLPVLSLALLGWGRVLPVPGFRWLEAILARTCVGMVMLMHAAFGLGLAGWLRPPVMIACVGVGAVLGAVDLWRTRADCPLRPSRLRDLDPGERALLLYLAATGLVYLLRAAPPSIAADTRLYHGWIAGHYADTGRIEYIPTYFGFQCPPGGWLLQASARLVSGPPLGTLLMVVLTGLAGGNLYALARDGGRQTALLAAAIGVTLPLVKHMVGAADEFAPMCFFATAATAALRRHAETGALTPALWGVAAAAGLAFTKYTTLPGAVAVVALLLATELRGRRPARTALLAAAALIAASPHYLRNLSIHGNPVFPLLSDVFGGRDWPGQSVQAFAESTAQRGTHDRTWAGWLSLPYCLFLTDHYTYRTSTLPFLLAIPGLWAVPADVRRAVLVPLGAALVPWFYTMQILRYLLPWLLPLAVPAAYAWSRASRSRRRAVAAGAAAVLAAGLAVELASNVREGWVQQRFHYLAGAVDPETYRETWMPAYRAYRYVDAVAAPDARVLVLDSKTHCNSACRRWQVMPHPFFQGWLLIEGVDDPGEQARRLREKGITWIVADHTGPPARFRALVESHAIRRFGDGTCAVYELRSHESKP